MYTNIILTTALAALAAAAPTKRQAAPADENYHGLSLNFNTASAFDPPAYKLVPVEIATLTAVDISGSAISFDEGSAMNVPIDDVECRAYRDADGVQPGSAPFTKENPALLSTNVVTIASVLCYVKGPEAPE